MTENKKATGQARTAEAKNAEAIPQEQSAEIKTASVGSKIEVVGPYDATNGAIVFRLNRANEKKPTLDLVPGQVLTVGGTDGDITKAEAEILLNNGQWVFKSK